MTNNYAISPIFDRKAHWEKVYTEKSPLVVSWYQKEPTLSLQLICNASITKNAPIIDVGGGTSMLVDRLYTEAFENIAVLDVSTKALNYARERLEDKTKAIEWYEADVTEFRSPYPFVLWHDRAVFHFLTDAEDRMKYVDVLNRTLVPGGHVIIATFAIGGPTKCSGLDTVQYDSARLLSELGSDFVLVEEKQETHIPPANKEQKFSYFRLIKKY